jgi:hypothetical protein
VPEFTFEVKTLSDNRWTVESIHKSDTLALKRARELVKANQCEGVEVARERIRSDGTFTGSVIFKQMLSGPGDPQVQIVAIDDAPDCQSFEEVYGLEARLTMWKVLRKYFEQVGLTPSEVLHNYGALSKLMDNDPPVYPAAIDRIATIQARRSGQDSKERRDELYRWADMVASRAREAELEKHLRKFGLKDFKALLEACYEEGGPARRDHLARCMIARQFYLQRNFLSKLEDLLKAASPDLDRDALAILDGFIADILGSATVIQEILGNRSNLCNALIGLIDLMEGKEEELPPLNEPELVQVLRRLFADGALPNGAQVLLDRVKTQIEGRQPLNRANPEQEDASFNKLLGRLASEKGIMGGPQMAEALTTRCGLKFPEGGDVGRRRSVTAMLSLIRDPLQKLRYLLHIAETQTGSAAMDVLLSAVDFLAAQAMDIHGFVNPRLPPTKKMMLISDLQRALVRSALPEDLRTRVVDQLDEMLCDFVQRDGFIDRLDDPDLGLRERASRLVKFCSSGILLEGRALQIARKRIAEHLRQPNFVEKLTEGCRSRTEAEGVVRTFHQQLADAGFAA